MGLRVSAPGKLMLSGEYAVLDGATAVVAAVDARATATVGAPPLADTPPEVSATWRLARERFPKLPSTPPRIDVSALRDPSGAQKLGLGSSAAAAAATAGLALAFAHGADALADGATREALFTLAFRGHAVIAPEGSGADVAAASLGGYIRFQPAPPGSQQLPTCAPLRAPAGLTTRVVWTGHAARTSDLVGQVKRFKARDPGPYAAHQRELADAAEAFATTFAAGSAVALLPLAARYHEAMRALGDAAGAPIVEEHLRAVADLAARCGGAAKPSGAGGGDVAIAFFCDEADAERFDARVADTGFETLRLTLGAPGPRVD